LWRGRDQRSATPENSRIGGHGYALGAMTAREKLREAVERLSEQEAEETLLFLDARERDPLLAAVLRAPLDDEPSSPEEDRSAEDAWAQYNRGEALPLSEIHDEP